MIDGLLYEVNKPITKAAKFGQNVGKLVHKLDRKLHSWSEGITWKFNGWLKQAEKQANNVKNGIVDTGKQIGKGAENVGKKVWGGIKSKIVIPILRYNYSKTNKCIIFVFIEYYKICKRLYIKKKINAFE